MHPLSHGNIADLNVDTTDNPLDMGSRVAIIDFRVFVPEVISVLATFSSAHFVQHLSSIPFVNQLIGIADDNKIQRVNYASLPIRSCIEQAIMNSEIECIRRLPIKSKSRLVDIISSLKPIQSLYGTQLDAFACGLQFPAHCTQGPPGTGKVRTNSIFNTH